MMSVPIPAIVWQQYRAALGRHWVRGSKTSPLGDAPDLNCLAASYYWLLCISVILHHVDSMALTCVDGGS